MREIDPVWTFKELLAQKDHVMPGVPILWVLSDASQYLQTFLKRFDPQGW
jgi:hypothetical protein